VAGNRELVLAQLATGGPNYRYDLGRTIVALNGADKSTVYKALDRLEEQGCVSAVEHDQRAAGARGEPVLMFDITEAGRARVRAWMHSELPTEGRPHTELRQRMLFAAPEDLPGLLEVVKAALRRCAEGLADASGPAVVRQSRIAEAADLLEERGNAELAQTILDWLRSAVATLERLIREETSAP